METTFLVIFVLSFLFLFFQTYGANNTVIMASSNVTCIRTERHSLLLFRQGLKDESNRLSTWTGVECCEWQGVGCDRRNGHVVKLDLRSPLSFTDDGINTRNWLKGKVSPSLLNLKHLRYLDLSMNNFSGQRIPEFFGSFKCLEYLNLSLSGFGGEVPHHLGNLSSLQYLDLSIIKNYDYKYDYDLDRYDVYLVDDLRWLSSLSSLKHLDLSGITIGNHIDWFHPVNMLPSLLTLNLAWCDINYISIKFTNFTSLSSLDLSSNGIDSTIPVWLSNLTGLMHLDLHDNFFHGRIPDSIGKLTSLASIDLSQNSFNTCMPDLFWNLSSLVRLDLSSNAFHGPVPADVKLCNLSVLNLSGNEFAGDLSSFIGNTSSDCLHNSLKDLKLERNQFNGRIPNKIGEFKKLESLDLSVNTLSGPIPESIGQLSRLKELYLHSNQLSGFIPASLGQLSNLEELDVSHNSLLGVLSEIHFTKLNNLTYLSLSYNSLTLNVSPGWIPPFQLYSFDASSCNIGPRFPSLIQTSVNLGILSLSNSSIRDRIPEWFDNISSHIGDLDLSHNQIRGKLPRLQSRYTLNLKSNKFEGSLTSFPSNVYLLDLSDNLLSGHVPYTDRTMNPDLVVVILANNQFTGSVPVHLCKFLSIQVLDLSNNKFSRRLPGCLGNLIKLEVIDLSNNTITGTVPNSLGSLTQVKSLHLHNNRLEGNIPVSLQNLTQLITMDIGNNLFTGRIPFWIGQKLSTLRFLNLQSNKFSGSIPLQLCQLSELQYLNLANNNLNGTIPHCFQNLGMVIDQDIPANYTNRSSYEEYIFASMKGNQLQYTKTMKFLISLDLSRNKIFGNIPDVLMNLVALKSLNLSRNLLKGGIPTMVGNLKQMESLDLSVNKLSGGIPLGLSSLNFLSYLNVSFNNLYGPIPVGNQLQTLDDPYDIYKGNIGLCGPPLSRSCNGNNLSYTRVGEDEGKDDTEGLWFYTGMGLGFVVGFIGLIGSLHIVKIWRVAYFEMIENVYTWLMVSFLVTLARIRRIFF